MPASKPTPAAVGMTGLAWLMNAEERNRQNGENKQLVPFAATTKDDGGVSSLSSPMSTSIASSSGAASPSPSATLFKPFEDPAISEANNHHAEVVRGLVANSPESPTTDYSKAVGPLRTDSSTSMDSTTASFAASVTPKQVGSLMDSSKKVMSHLKVLAERDQAVELMEPNGSLPTYENLVTRLVDKFQTQREINSVRTIAWPCLETFFSLILFFKLVLPSTHDDIFLKMLYQANSRLFSLSYIVQMHNYARTRQVMKEVSHGKRQIATLQGNVRELEQNVEDISVDLEAQKAQAEVFKQNLENTQSLLNKVMVDYRDELNRQREVLRRQQRYLGSMYTAKLSQDLALDIFICIFGVYIVSHPFIRHPLNFLGSSFNQLVPLLLRRDESIGAQRTAAEQRGVFIQQLVRILAFIALVRRARDLAMGYGLHNKVGAAFSYFTFLTDNVRNRLFGAEDLVPETTSKLLEEGQMKMLEYEPMKQITQG